MKTVSQRFSNVLKEGICPILKENGFRRKGQNFFKPLDEVGHIINIQKDKWNSKDEIKFTINIGVFSNIYWLSELDFENTKILPEFPKESESIIRKRIGELKYGEDYWYSIESQRSERKLIKDVASDIENYVTPFFNKIDSSDKLIKHLKSNQNVFGNDFKLFVFLAENGLMEEAQIKFDELMNDCHDRYKERLENKRIKYSLKNKI